jgi:lysophospholipase L1-like esterase
MSVLHSVRTRLLVCCVASITALGAPVLAPTAGATKLGSTYLALGDSYAYGYHAVQFKEELNSKGFVEPATFNDGYVDDFGAALKLANHNLQVINDGCPGETTDTMIKGSGVPLAPGFCAGGPTGTPFPYPFLHHPYTTGLTGSQLSDALAILKANPNVSPITLDIGGNDVLQACGPPKACNEVQLAPVLGHIAANVGSILEQLRAAAPHAQIVLLGYFNAFPTALPPPGGDKAIAAVNAVLAGVAAKVSGVSFANPLPFFNPSVITGRPETQDIPTICAFTAMCPGGTFNPVTGDLHPNKLGYAVLAGVVGFDFLTH